MRTPALPSVVFGLAALTLVSCGGSSPSGDDVAETPTTTTTQPAATTAPAVTHDERPWGDDRPDPQQLFYVTERKMLDAPGVEAVAEIVGENVIPMDVVSHLLLTDRNEAVLEFSGMMGNRDTDVRFVSNGDRMNLRPWRKKPRRHVPDFLRSGMIRAFLRLGAVHHVLVTQAHLPPDRITGRMAQEVIPREFTLGADEEIDGRNCWTISFDTVVQGRVSASATLWIDQQSLLPVQRTQQTYFEQGDHQVFERYATLDLAPRPTPGVFELPALPPRPEETE
ncbi:MAG: hypothetical protein AAF533_08435 [Acidobacteriota bacterium]